MARTERLHLRITQEEREAIARFAKLEDRSMSDWVRTAIRQRLGREVLNRRKTEKQVGQLYRQEGDA